MTNRKNKKEAEKVRIGRVGERSYWIFYVSIFLRAIHQVGAAVFLASFVLKDITMPALYLIIAFVSGMLLLITEGLRHRQILRELTGAATMFKLILLGLAYHGWMPGMFTALFAFVLASLCSHAPKSIRHRLLF